MEWVWSSDHGQLGQVIQAQALWGETTCRVWLPESDSVVRISASRLKPLDRSNTDSPDFITYIASAARIAEAMSQDVLLAPIEASVIPLPHQIRVLKRAITDSRIRYLLADEVGLGKTIEAVMETVYLVETPPLHNASWYSDESLPSPEARSISPLLSPGSFLAPSTQPE